MIARRVRTTGPALVAALALARSAAASDDGVYGRLDGDLDLSVAAGSAVAHGGASGVATGRALFLGTAGAYATYADAFDSTKDAPRSVALGFELRPLFLPRWASDWEHGPAVLDLALDSIALDLGAFWAAPPGGSIAGPPGLELGTGFEVPIGTAAYGPFIGVRGAWRWAAAELAGGPGAGEHGAMALLTLGWRASAATHLVDAGDRARR